MANGKAKARASGVETGAIEAVVTEVEGDGPIRVRSTKRGRRAIAARVSVLGYRPSVGDRVVVLEGANEAFVVGVLHAAHGLELRTDAGASAKIEGSSIVVRDGDGSIVATYDGSTRETRIVADHGDLVLAAPSGKVVVSAGTDVSLQASGAIETTSNRVSVHAEHSSVNVERAELVARAVTSLVGRWELRAQRLVEHAVDAYRDVDGVLQTRAGRMRTVVQGAYRVLARRTDILSQEDSVIDGKRVLLG